MLKKLHKLLASLTQVECLKTTAWQHSQSQTSAGFHWMSCKLLCSHFENCFWQQSIAMSELSEQFLNGTPEHSKVTQSTG